MPVWRKIALQSYLVDVCRAVVEEQKPVSLGSLQTHRFVAVPERDSVKPTA